MTSITDCGSRPTERRAESHARLQHIGRFLGMERDELPEPLRRAVERAVELAREGGDR